MVLPRLVCFAVVVTILNVEVFHAYGQEKPHSPVQHQTRSFDYYLLSLSWSPQYCAEPVGKNDHQQCGRKRRYGFVVHGLWPQYEKGYPEFCGHGSQVSEPLMQKMLPIMPNKQLIRHEWEKHGTCSGLTVEQYFKKTADAFALLVIPSRYKNPSGTISLEPGQLKQDLVVGNPDFTEESFALLCKGRFLKEVRVCLDK